MDTEKELLEKKIQELSAMIDYAMSHGKQVSPKALDTLQALQNQLAVIKNKEAGKNNNGGYENKGLEDLTEDFVQPPISENLTKDFANIHQELSNAIYPAQPATLLMMDKEKNQGGLLRWFGPINFVRYMNFVALTSLVVFLGMFLLESVDSKTIMGNVLEYNGWQYITHQLFFLSAAALGASFYSLFEAYRYIVTASFDDRYEAVYWIRFILGLVAGIMLSEFIDVRWEEFNNSSLSITRPLLAFLGGFSANVVYKILRRLVDTIEAFIEGSAKDMLEERKERTRIEIEAKMAKMREQKAAEATQDRYATMIKLIEMKSKLANGKPMDTQNLSKEIDGMINVLMTPVDPNKKITDFSISTETLKNNNNNANNDVTIIGNNNSGNLPPKKEATTSLDDAYLDQLDPTAVPTVEAKIPKDDSKFDPDAFKDFVPPQ